MAQVRKSAPADQRFAPQRRQERFALVGRHGFQIFLESPDRFFPRHVGADLERIAVFRRSAYIDCIRRDIGIAAFAAGVLEAPRVPWF